MGQPLLGTQRTQRKGRRLGGAGGLCLVLSSRTWSGIH